MIYVFDSSTLIRLFKNFYPKSFPSLWEKFAQVVNSGNIISVREVFIEIEDYDDRLSEWAKRNRAFFQQPSKDELVFVADIFKVTHFQSMVRTQERLQGKPVADPFVIAKAKILKGCVVAEESKKPNSSRIPNVREYFDINCLNLEGFMERENWTF